jgi:hypothetical protein
MRHANKALFSDNALPLPKAKGQINAQMGKGDERG